MMLLIMLLLPILTTVPLVRGSNDAEAKGVCVSLIHSSNSNEMNVLAVGLVSNSFLLVTKDFWVFELERDAIAGAVNSSRVYMGSTPMRLEEKWPTLAKDPQYQKIKNNLYNAFTAMDSESDYLLFITFSKEFPEPGVTFDLKNDKVYKGFKFNREKKQVMISGYQKLLFYGLRPNTESNTLELAQYSFKDDGKTVKSSKAMVVVSQWQRLCSEDDGDQIRVTKNAKENCTGLNWPITKGFIDGDQVFLFAPKYIYIFQLSAIQMPGSKVPLAKKLYDGFFVCHPDYLKWALIAAAILLLLLLIALLIWCCCCRKKKKKKKGGQEPEASGDANSSSKKQGKSKRDSKSTKNSKSKGKPMSIGASALTRRSKGGTKKSVKNPKSKLTSKYDDQNNLVTGRSAFKPASKSAKKSKPASKYDDQHNLATGRSAYKPSNKPSNKPGKKSKLTSKYDDQNNNQATGRSAFNK